MITEKAIYNDLIVGWIVLSVAIFVSLFFIVAPYGRHVRARWGRTVQSSLGWIIMESTSPLVFAICFMLGTNRNTWPEIIFLLLWEAHYIHRAYIYPLHIRGGEKPMPLAVISMGFLFNAVNSYLNGRFIFSFSDGYANSWLLDPRFIIGVIIYVSGFVINRNSDIILRNLREPGKPEYQMTDKGLFRWISCPNYLGEIMIWSGWAIATWSLAGLSFALWTAANLVPRARANHRWYKQHFADYPAQKRALVPKVW
jgi:3-oxo-5-alpha-steroid 4-dehydrogenase 1